MKTQSPAFSYSGSELEAMAEAESYHRWIFSRVAPHLGSRIIEVGAGVGTFASVLLAEVQVSELVLVEPADNLFPHLANRFAAGPRVRVVKGYLENCIPQSPLDSLIAVNVIEHVAEDIEFLRLALKIQ
jgi:hypothetical protein